MEAKVFDSDDVAWAKELPFPIIYEEDEPVAVVIRIGWFRALMRRLKELGGGELLAEIVAADVVSRPTSGTDGETLPPTEVTAIQDLRHPALRLAAPLFVTVQRGDKVIVNNSDLDIFGYGDTESEAIDDFRQCAVETYFDLKADQDRLGPHLQRVWNFLSHMVAEVK